jgi:hypothetical protein
LNLDYASALAPVPNWSGLDTVALTNAAQWYFDAAAPLPSERYYRAWGTNVLGPPPALDLHLVPALTLTGTVGSNVRVDYINQFGPIDAWVTNLATVTLTNTSQLYFDTSVIGEPARLYRLVPVP